MTCFICEPLGKCITPEECYAEAETTERIKQEEQLSFELEEGKGE